jgi:hypothetical protein
MAACNILLRARRNNVQTHANGADIHTPHAVTQCGSTLTSIEAADCLSDLSS